MAGLYADAQVPPVHSIAFEPVLVPFDGVYPERLQSLLGHVSESPLL